MTKRLALTRRAVLAALGAATALPRGAIAAPEKPRDVGIGGTGFAPEGQSGSDRGIGGTGFTGTIQRFGSIVVNDRRIAYGPDVPVTIDGQARSARDLRIGHVVRVVAQSGSGGLATDAISVDNEVVGPVTAVDGDGIEVLGQRVVLAGAPRSWRKGQRVAVSGLRRLDGAIVASLIEPRGRGPSRILGILERDEDGFWIDRLKLLHGDEAHLGRRVLVTGQLAHGGFLPAHIENAPVIAARGPVSIESYVRAREGSLLLGSGLSVRSDAFASDLSGWGEVRAVLDGRFGLNGELSIDSIRLARTRGEGEGHSGASPGPGGFGPGPTGPGGFGPGGPGPGPGPGGFGGPGPGGGPGGGAPGGGGAGPGGGGPGAGPGGGSPGGGGGGPGGGGPGGGGGDAGGGAGR